jgi:hypothetical protein
LQFHGTFDFSPNLIFDLLQYLLLLSEAFVEIPLLLDYVVGPTMALINQKRYNGNWITILLGFNENVLCIAQLVHQPVIGWNRFAKIFEFKVGTSKRSTNDCRRSKMMNLKKMKKSKDFFVSN